MARYFYTEPSVEGVVNVYDEDGHWRGAGPLIAFEAGAVEGVRVEPMIAEIQAKISTLDLRFFYGEPDADGIASLYDKEGNWRGVGRVAAFKVDNLVDFYIGPMIPDVAAKIAARRIAAVDEHFRAEGKLN